MESVPIGEIANLSGVAMVFVLVWYLETRRLPEKERQYREDIHRLTDDFKQTLEEERRHRDQQWEQYQQALRRTEEQFQQTLTEISAEVLEGLQEILESVKQITTGRKDSS